MGGAFQIPSALRRNKSNIHCRSLAHPNPCLNAQAGRLPASWRGRTRSKSCLQVVCIYNCHSAGLVVGGGCPPTRDNLERARLIVDDIHLNDIYFFINPSKIFHFSIAQ
jgi:hypothetical protein